METAKVDIQKLQLLNDRINQTIDALNHVRASVHGLQSGPSFVPPMWQGLSHSPVVGGVQGGIGMQGLMSPWAQQSQYTQQSPFAQQAIGQQIPFGLQSLFGQQSPWGPIGPQSPIGLQGPYGPQLGQQAYGTGFGLGHTPYHTPYDAYVTAGGYVDPLILARVAQTFPFAYSPVPPRRY